MSWEYYSNNDVKTDHTSAIIKWNIVHDEIQRENTFFRKWGLPCEFVCSFIHSVFPATPDIAPDSPRCCKSIYYSYNSYPASKIILQIIENDKRTTKIKIRKLWKSNFFSISKEDQLKCVQFHQTVCRD